VFWQSIMMSVDWASCAGTNGSSANARKVFGSDTPPSVCRQSPVAVAIREYATKSASGLSTERC
jgi:hypothetical protein